VRAVALAGLEGQEFPGDAAGANGEQVPGPEGAGKWLPLRSWSQGVAGAPVGCPVA